MNLHRTLQGHQRTLCYTVADNPKTRFETDSSFFNKGGDQLYRFHVKNTLQKRNHLNQEFINKDLDFSASSLTLCISPFYKDTRHLQLNTVERNVEFVSVPQHETSYDPETTTKEDFNCLIQQKRSSWKH